MTAVVFQSFLGFRYYRQHGNTSLEHTFLSTELFSTLLLTLDSWYGFQILTLCLLFALQIFPHLFTSADRKQSKIPYCLKVFCFGMCVDMYMPWHMWRSEDKLQDWFSPTIWVPGIKSSLSGLTANLHQAETVFFGF